MKSSFVLRTRIILLGIVLFAGILSAKLFYVQIIHGNTYSEAADRQYVTPSTSIYERGSVYFERKDGELVSAATQISGFKLAVNPSKIVDAEDAYEKISKIISLDHDEFVKRAGNKNDPYEEVTGQLSKEQA
ncbi:MAG: hypothetical protein WAV15_00865, partial [Minisyncoccia bacterium]